MKKIIVTKNGQVVFEPVKEDAEVSAYIAKQIASENWGKNAYTIPAELDENDNVINPAVDVPAEYTYTIVDITSEVSQAQINAEALAYLASTDWYILREMDGGTACPVDIKAARADARARVVR